MSGQYGGPWSEGKPDDCNPYLGLAGFGTLTGPSPWNSEGRFVKTGRPFPFAGIVMRAAGEAKTTALKRRKIAVTIFFVNRSTHSGRLL